MENEKRRETLTVTNRLNMVKQYYEEKDVKARVSLQLIIWQVSDHLSTIFWFNG